MKKWNKRVWGAASVAVLCGASYIWFYSSHWPQWQPAKSSQFAQQKNTQDPSYLAYQAAEVLSLIAGVQKQSDGQYQGTVAWQANRDLLGVAAPGRPGRLQLLSVNRFEDEVDGSFDQGAAVFHLETQGDQPVQAIGVLRLRYDASAKQVLAVGKPQLALVSPIAGKVDYQYLTLAGDINMLRVSKTGRTPQGYQRTDAGLIAFIISTNRLLLTLHYVANLIPPQGDCRVGQASPCRKIVTAFSASGTDGNASTADLPSVKLDSTLLSEHGQKKSTYRLEYDPARLAYLQFGGRGIEQIEALSPVKVDAFLTSLPPPGEVRLR